MNSKMNALQSVHEYGLVLTDIKNFCNSKCNNLLDTSEVTLAEKNCTFNCFKKMNYAYNNFNRITNDDLDLSSIKEPNREFKY